MKFISKIALFFCFFNILGCVSKVEVKPDYLSHAVLNKYYEQVIEIEKINLVGEVIIDNNLPEKGIVVFNLNQNQNISRLAEKDKYYGDSKFEKQISLSNYDVECIHNDYSVI